MKYVRLYLLLTTRWDGKNYPSCEPYYRSGLGSVSVYRCDGRKSLTTLVAEAREYIRGSGWDGFKIIQADSFREEGKTIHVSYEMRDKEIVY